MAELMFGLRQTKNKKESEAKVRFTKSHLKNVTITDTVESIVRSDQHYRDQKYKETKRETKKNLKYASQEETGEMAVRKQQADREKRWKQTGRNQIKKNSKFDMARSLFGGGCPVPSAHRHDDEQISKPINKQIDKEEYYEEVISEYYGDTITEYYEEELTEELTEYSEEYVDEEFVFECVIED